MSVLLQALKAILQGGPFQWGWISTTSGSPEGNLHLVGGSAFLIELTRDGISQRVLRQWGDEVGKRIKPPVAATGAPMSRQQRRALERKAA